METRRAFLGAAASGAASLALGGCGDSGTKSATPPATQSAAAGGPRGKLAVALPTLGTAENYLPWLEAGREGWLVLGALYESLVDSDPVTGDYTPCLAERWAVED